MSREVAEPIAIVATWAAAGKWAVRESGDAVSVVQLGSGRVLGMIVDVQGGGGGAGATAWSLVTLGRQLAAEGVDALTLASTLNRALWTRRGGRVQAGLGVVIGEPGGRLSTATYGSAVVATTGPTTHARVDDPPPAGLDRDAVPSVGGGMSDVGTLALCSDGIAGTAQELLSLLESEPGTPPSAASVLRRAVARDEGRPRNDMSIIVMSTAASEHIEPSISGELRVGHRPLIGRRGASGVDDLTG